MSIIKADQVNVVSDNVKLTKEQAEKLEKLLYLSTKEKVIKDFVTAEERSKAGFTLDTLIRALYIGYDVEISPEEMALQYYEILGNKSDQKTIEDILDILNIKVKGINK